MRAALFFALAGILAPICLGSLAAAQTQPPAPPPPPEEVTSPQTEQAVAQLPPERLDQLTAPIALYPDPLLGQILMAATYPLEVVEADRWLQQDDNAALKGDQLAAALAQQRWDPSVKSLVAFPQILRMMDGNLGWTEELGDAFLAGQAAVMDSVQRLRQTAAASGQLKSTPQEVVSNDGGIIVIEQPEPDVVHVPVYDPNVVYGRWPHPDYPPDYFPGYFPSVAVEPQGFGWFDVAIVAPLWRWARSDWHRHRIDVDPNRFNHHWPPIAWRTWHHDPAHRGDRDRDPALRDRFERAAPSEAVRGIRGFPTIASALAAQPTVNPARPTAAVVGMPPVLQIRYAPAIVNATPPAPPTKLAPAATPPTRLAPAAAPPTRLAPAAAPPEVLRPARMVVVQSFGHRPELRPAAQRVQVGRLYAPPPRAAMPAPAPRGAVPVARAAPTRQGSGVHR